MMKKAGGTLFSYFKPVASGTTSPQPAKPKSATSKPQTEKTGDKSVKVLSIEGTPVSVGLLVWAKMAGHPWWPGLVTPHPVSNAFKKGRKHIEVHVQFFGQPPSRGWAPLTCVELFSAGSANAHTERISGFDEAKTEAMEAMKMAVKERESLIVHIESDESDEGKDEPPPTPASGKKRQHSLESEEDGGSDTLESKDSGCVSETPQPKRNRVRPLDSDVSEDDYVPTSGGESDGESGEEKSGVDDTLHSDCEEEGENEEEEPVTTAKKRKSKPSGGVPSKRSKCAPSTPKGSKSKCLPSTPKQRKASAGGAAPNTPTSSADLDTSSTSSVCGPSRKFQHESLDWLSLEMRKDKEGHTVNDPEYNPRTIRVPRDYLNNLTPGVRQWWDIKMDNFDTVLFLKVGKFYELYHMDAVIGVQELGLAFMKGEFAHCGFPEVAFGRYAQTLVQKGYKVARVEQTETPLMMEKRVKNCTRTMSLFDGDIMEEEAAYLLAVKQKVQSGEVSFGVCFVDTCIGKFHILYQRGNLGDRVLKVLNAQPSCIKDCLVPGSEFCDASKTLKMLAEGGYFSSGPEQDQEFKWPESLKKMLADDDSLGLTARDEFELAISALGACTWWLKKCCIEHELLSLANFEEYQPLDLVATDPVGTSSIARQRMILDDITLFNLDVVPDYGKKDGTLLERLDHCVTPFGKRLLKQWICAPLCHPAAINERLDAVTDLVSNASLVGEVRKALRGSAKRSQDHPDSRAVFYEEATYGRRRLMEFTSVVEGFTTTLEVVKLFEPVLDSISSKLLRKLVTLASDGGVNPSYDEALEDIETTRHQLMDYLSKQRKRLGCNTIAYWATNAPKNRYQMEVPESVYLRHIPEEYELKSQKKGVRRYWTKEIESNLERLTEAEERRDAALKDSMRTLFQTFAEQ
eukprot:Em0013g759a